MSNLSPIPAMLAAMPAREHRMTQIAQYDNQQEAEAGSIEANLFESRKVILEIAGNRELLGNTQVMTELDQRLEWLTKHAPNKLDALLIVDRWRAEKGAPMTDDREDTAPHFEALAVAQVAAEKAAKAAGYKSVNAYLDATDPNQPECDKPNSLVDAATAAHTAIKTKLHACSLVAQAALQVEIAQLRADLEALGVRPEPVQDEWLLDAMAYIREKVAPQRTADSLQQLDIKDAGSLAGNLGAIFAMDDGAVCGGISLADLMRTVDPDGDPDATFDRLIEEVQPGALAQIDRREAAKEDATGVYTRIDQAVRGGQPTVTASEVSYQHFDRVCYHTPDGRYVLIDPEDYAAMRVKPTATPWRNPDTGEVVERGYLVLPTHEYPQDPAVTIHYKGVTSAS